MELKQLANRVWVYLRDNDLAYEPYGNFPQGVTGIDKTALASALGVSPQEIEFALQGLNRGQRLRLVQTGRITHTEVASSRMGTVQAGTSIRLGYWVVNAAKPRQSSASPETTTPELQAEADADEALLVLRDASAEIEQLRHTIRRLTQSHEEEKAAWAQERDALKQQLAEATSLIAALREPKPRRLVSISDDIGRFLREGLAFLQEQTVEGGHIFNGFSNLGVVDCAGMLGGHFNISQRHGEKLVRYLVQMELLKSCAPADGGCSHVRKPANVRASHARIIGLRISESVEEVMERLDQYRLRVRDLTAYASWLEGALAVARRRLATAPGRETSSVLSPALLAEATQLLQSADGE